MIGAAILLAFAPLFFTGCASFKPKTVAPKSYQQGYIDGVAKGRKAYVAEYGDLLRSCTSRDVVSDLNKKLTSCKKLANGAKKYAQNCLKGFKLERTAKETEEKALTDCKANLGSCIFEKQDLDLRCGK